MPIFAVSNKGGTSITLLTKSGGTLKTAHKVMKTKVNSYNIYDENHYSTVLYHALAESEEQVRELAEESGIDLEGLSIEKIRTDVRDESGYPYEPKIEDALVH